MELEATADNVERVLYEFYSQGFSAEANKWLIDTQQSDSAWSLAWDFLNLSKPYFVQFYGASALVYKMTEDKDGMKKHCTTEFRDALIMKLVEFAEKDASHAVLSKLMIAVTHSLFCLIPHGWPNAIESLIDFVNINLAKTEENQGRVMCAFIELIKIIPEEFFAILLPSCRRNEIRFELEKSVPRIMAYMRFILGTTGFPRAVYCNAVLTVSSWMQFSVDLDQRMDLIELIFNAVKDVELFEIACECLGNIFSHPNIHRFPNTVRQLLPSLVELQDMLKTSLQSPDEHDIASGLVRLICTVCECHIHLLLDMCVQSNGQQLVFQLVSIMLLITDAPGRFPIDEEVSDTTFTFWYMLQDDITSRDENSSNQLTQIFQPIYTQLIFILLKKCQLSSEEENLQFSEEEKEKFRCYRQDVSDTMMYSYNILRQSLLEWIFKVLQSFCTSDSDTSQLSWKNVEAVLFLTEAIAENVVSDEAHDGTLRDIFALLPRLKLENMLCIRAALDVISAYQEWMSDNAYILSSVLPTVLRCLDLDRELRISSGLALRNICQINQLQVRLHANTVLSSIFNLLRRSLEAEIQGNGELVLDTAETNRLMSCVGYIVSVIPSEHMIQSLEDICTPFIQHLIESSQQTTFSSALRSCIVNKLCLFSWLFTAMQKSNELDDDTGNDSSSEQDFPDTSAPHLGVLWVLQKISPAIENISIFWCTDQQMLEALFDLFKWALRATQEAFEPFVLNLVCLVLKVYVEQPLIVLLDLSKQIILSFYNKPSHRDMIIQLIQQIVITTLGHFQRAERQHNLRDLTEVLEGFLGLMVHVVKRASGVVQIDKVVNLAGVLRVAMCGVTMHEMSTLKTSCIFLTEFVANSSKYNGDQVILSYLTPLNHRIIKAIGGDSPRCLVEPLASVLITLVRAYTEIEKRSLSELMAVENFPTHRISLSEKDRFINSLVKYKGHKKTLKQEIFNFGLRCRGLYGSAHVADDYTNHNR